MVCKINMIIQEGLSFVAFNTPSMVSMLRLLPVKHTQATAEPSKRFIKKTCTQASVPFYMRVLFCWGCSTAVVLRLFLIPPPIFGPPYTGHHDIVSPLHVQQ